MRIAALALVAGCASAHSGQFRDQPIVWRVDDAQPIDEPEEQPFHKYRYYFNGFVFHRLQNAIDSPKGGRGGRALDTNALDEVPDSTWFENRIGLHPIDAAAITRGAGLQPPPTLPLTIVNAKTEGGNPGFFAKDAAGIRYLIKFDTTPNPEQQSAGDVIVNRLFWAAGYHVPSDHVFYFRRSDLKIGPKMVGKLSESDVDKLMTGAAHRGDEIRALASAFLPGKPKGGWPILGTRASDRNDTIPHEFRRELRALRVFAAWLGHTDLKPDNTLDMYVDEDGKKFLRHYLVDFGEALGGHQSEKNLREVGFEHGWDWAAQSFGFITFGLWVRNWEHQEPTPFPAVGFFAAARFEPDHWRERYPYEPFRYMDAADSYWAAKIIMRFERTHLEAVVAESKLSDPAAGAFLVETLWQRRLKVGATYLDRVTPFDQLAIEGTRLCGTDLSLRYGVATTGTVEARDGDNAAFSYPANAAHRTCIPLATDGSYHILRVQIRRGETYTPTAEIHYRSGAAPRILGVVR
ncbi:MAG: hypothetical protein ABI867_14735 [Kofleriaceae bacterium]